MIFFFISLRFSLTVFISPMSFFSLGLYFLLDLFLSIDLLQSVSLLFFPSFSSPTSFFLSSSIFFFSLFCFFACSSENLFSNFRQHLKHVENRKLVKKKTLKAVIHSNHKAKPSCVPSSRRVAMSFKGTPSNHAY